MFSIYLKVDGIFCFVLFFFNIILVFVIQLSGAIQDGFPKSDAKEKQERERKLKLAAAALTNHRPREHG